MIHVSVNVFTQADRHFPNRSSRRVLHGAIQITACMFIVLGYLCALAQHAVDGTNNLGGGGVTQAYSVHTWMGYASLAFILGQARASMRARCCVNVILVYVVLA